MRQSARLAHDIDSAALDPLKTLNNRMTKPSQHAQFIARIRTSPVLQAIRTKSEFACAATVETGASVDVYTARVWATPNDDGSSSRLVGRYRFSRAYPDADEVLWEFEFDDDALIFVLRFGGEARGRVDVREWRGSVLRSIER